MASYQREEMEAMVAHWLATNLRAEETGDWRVLAECYAEDATYGWNYGPDVDFMTVGRGEIRDVAIGLEMGGLGGWTYPYQEILIDEKKGQVVGFWKQVADATREDGSHYTVAGIGGSWFLYGGNMQWRWQRDWFDYGNAAAVFMEMMTDNTLSEVMVERMHRSLGGSQPGHFPLGGAPSPIWPDER